MTTVYVISKDGEPLMPTTRCGHVRHLLDTKKARVVSLKPFTIGLKYKTENVVQELYGGTDPGRTNIGNAVVSSDGTCKYRDKVESRNGEVSELMSKRKTHRQASRRGERLARKRLAKKHNTISKKLKNGRLIAGTKKPTNVKDIINTEARFQNRKKRQLITPSVRQLIETHLNHIDMIRKMLPVKEWCLEANKFSFMKMEDGSVMGIDFQNGRLKGYKNADEFVYERQGGKCLCCGGPIEHYHHIVPGSQGGSDGPENKAGVCNRCHAKIHTGEITLDVEGFYKKYGALSVVNQAVPYIYLGLVDRFGEENVHLCQGYETKVVRETSGLEKDHDTDAICIACACIGMEPKEPEVPCFKVKQFRRHDRALIQYQRERTYKYGYKAVAKNRKPRFEQKGLSLKDWHDAQIEAYGEEEARRMVGRLEVTVSRRAYNDTDRVMPGALIMYMPSDDIKPKIPPKQIFVLTGQLSGGQYFIYKKKRIPARNCVVLSKNKGLVYV